MKFRGRPLKAISLECQHVLYHHRFPVENVYEKLAAPILTNPPTAEEFRYAFRQAYTETLQKFPHYRFPSSDPLIYSTRRWWRELCRHLLEVTNRKYTDVQVDRFFRAVYQHYGSSLGYAAYPDAVDFINSVSTKINHVGQTPKLLLGVTACVSTRTIDTTLPNLSLHDKLHFFTCSQEVFGDKKNLTLFNETFKTLKQMDESICKSEILHIGPSVNEDFAAARSYGFQALVLDREGKAEKEATNDLHLQHHLQNNIIKDLGEVFKMICFS